MDKKLVEKIGAQGGEAIFHECDVAREDEVQQSIEKTVAHFGGLQIIVNCAGVVHVVELHEYSEEEWDHLMGVNVKSIFFSIKHGHAHLVQEPAQLHGEYRFGRQLHRTSPNAGLHHFQACGARIKPIYRNRLCRRGVTLQLRLSQGSLTRRCCATT